MCLPVYTNHNGLFINPDLEFVGYEVEALQIAKKMGFSGIEIVYDMDCWKSVTWLEN